VTGDLDCEGILRGHTFDTLSSDHAQHQDNEQGNNGNADGGANRPTRAPVCCFIFFDDG